MSTVRMPGFGPVAVALVVTAGVMTGYQLVEDEAQVAAGNERSADGQVLFETTCSSCHGLDAKGTDLAPPLLDKGPGAVDWILRTGRMPLEEPGKQSIARSEPTFDRAGIAAVIAHLQTLGMTGPDIPTVELSDADVVRGGELFRLNCAACHQAVGQGGVVDGGEHAPSLQGLDPVTVPEVLNFGPGVMPNFAGLAQSDKNDLTAYVIDVVDEPDDRGGWGIGHLGPVPEGLVVWLVLLLGGIGALRWIGTRSPNQIVADPPGGFVIAAAAGPGPEPSTIDPSTIEPEHRHSLGTPDYVTTDVIERFAFGAFVTASLLGAVRWAVSRLQR